MQNVNLSKVVPAFDQNKVSQPETAPVGSSSTPKAEEVSKSVISELEKIEKQQAVENQKEVSTEEMIEAIRVVSEFVNQPPRNVDFLTDDDSGKTVVKVIDATSQELIKQFPSDEVLSMASKIKVLQQEIGAKSGLFINDSV